jgi:hypothetical protein
MRVDRIEVKRCFVASNKAKELGGKDKAAFLAGLAGIERASSKYDRIRS